MLFIHRLMITDSLLSLSKRQTTWYTDPTSSNPLVQEQTRCSQINIKFEKRK